MFVVVFLVSIPLAWVGYSLNWIKHRRQMLEDRSFFFHAQCNGDRSTSSRIVVIWRDGVCRTVVQSKEDIERARKLFPEAHIRWATVTK